MPPSMAATTLSRRACESVHASLAVLLAPADSVKHINEPMRIWEVLGGRVVEHGHHDAVRDLIEAGLNVPADALATYGIGAAPVVADKADRVLAAWVEVIERREGKNAE